MTWPEAKKLKEEKLIPVEMEKDKKERWFSRYRCTAKHADPGSIPEME